MKVLVGFTDMGALPWLYRFREDEDDPRRTIEVPDDLYERLMDTHEEFCAVLNEVHVECLEILDAPDPEPVRLEAGRTEGWPPEEVFIARCKSEGCSNRAYEPRERFWASKDHDQALSGILALGWRERRHGGLACPECAKHVPAEILLEQEVGA